MGDDEAAAAPAPAAAPISSGMLEYTNGLGLLIFDKLTLPPLAPR